jgi:hypothetical protein
MREEGLGGQVSESNKQGKVSLRPLPRPYLRPGHPLNFSWVVAYPPNSRSLHTEGSDTTQFADQTDMKDAANAL